MRYHLAPVRFVVQFLSHVQLFVIPWTAACQASLSFAVSWSLLRLMSIELVMLSNGLILCHPLLLLPSIFPSIRYFLMSQLFTSGGQSIGASASVLPMSIQGWFPLGLTGLFSLQSKGLLSTTIWKHQFFSAQPFLWSNSHMRTLLLEKPKDHICEQTCKYVFCQVSSLPIFSHTDHRTVIKVLFSMLHFIK